VILLDEPFEGLAPNIIKELFRVFDQLRGGAGARRPRVRARPRGRHPPGPARPLLTDLAYRKQILWV
jgi:hypothetical protein